MFFHQRGDDLDRISAAHDQVMVELLVQVSEAAGEEPPPVVAGTVPQAVVDDEQGDDLVALVEGASECAVVRQPQVPPEPDDAALAVTTGSSPPTSHRILSTPWDGPANGAPRVREQLRWEPARVCQIGTIQAVALVLRWVDGQLAE